MIIPTRRLDLVQINNKKDNLLSSGFCCSSSPYWENKKKRNNWQIFRPCQRTKKKLWNMWVTAILVVVGVLGKGIKALGNPRTNRDHSGYRIVEISQNIEMSPRDLRRLAITQTPVKDYQLWWEKKLTRRKKNEYSPGDPRRLVITQTPVKDYQLWWENNENSSGDLRRLAITQTPVKNYQLWWEKLTCSKIMTTINYWLKVFISFQSLLVRKWT